MGWDIPLNNENGIGIGRIMITIGLTSRGEVVVVAVVVELVADAAVIKYEEEAFNEWIH